MSLTGSHTDDEPHSRPRCDFQSFFQLEYTGFALGNAPDRLVDVLPQVPSANNRIDGHTLLTLQTSHLSSFNRAAKATDTEEKTLSYAKKYGVLSRPGYLNRCMHSNNMCSPNSVFLSVEENQKRSVLDDKL